MRLPNCKETLATAKYYDCRYAINVSSAQPNHAKYNKKNNKRKETHKETPCRAIQTQPNIQ